MTTADYYGLARPGRERTFDGVFAVLENAADRYRRWRKLRRAVGELRGLDDRMLKDIGLSRTTLYAAASDVYDQGVDHDVR